MRAHFTPEALEDLIDIEDFIAESNPARAATFAEELVDAANRLSDMPLAYPLRPEFGEDVRVRFHGDHAIVYRVDPIGVVVLRISHGARNLELMMRRESDKN